MQIKLLFFILLLPLISFGQCVKVDSVYSTCEIKQMENRNVLFGIKAITEDLLQTKGYDICDTGNIVTVNITYIGVPVNTFRIAGYAISNKITEVRITVAIGNQLYEGAGKWKSQAKIMMIELDNGVPFQQTTLSSAIKIALTQALSEK
jgi:hypothetical protein